MDLEDAVPVPGRRTAIAPGALSSVARSVLRVSTESSMARASRARSSDVSSSSSTTAWAPNRRASAASAERSALSRCTRANPPATSASTRNAATPTSNPGAGGSCAADERPRARSLGGSRSGTRARARSVRACVGRPVQRGRQAGAAIELAWVPFRADPAARRLDEVRVEQAPGAILLDPSAEARPPRRSASCPPPRPPRRR